MIAFPPKPIPTTYSHVMLIDPSRRLRTSFPVGSGSRFTLASPGFSGNLDITVSSSAKIRLVSSTIF